MKKNHHIADFSQWLRINSLRLYDLDSRQAAAEISKQLEIVDVGLGVEVQRHQVKGSREMIITAFSNSALFELVHQIVQSIGPLAPWEIIALKPPRGFAFKITVGQYKLNASELSFAPIPNLDASFQLIPPHEIAPGKSLEELAWLTVETGIGEELAAHIQHLEFASKTEKLSGESIGELAAYLKVTTNSKR